MTNFKRVHASGTTQGSHRPRRPAGLLPKGLPLPRGHREPRRREGLHSASASSEAWFYLVPKLIKSKARAIPCPGGHRRPLQAHLPGDLAFSLTLRSAGTSNSPAFSLLLGCLQDTPGFTLGLGSGELGQGT